MPVNALVIDDSRLMRTMVMTSLRKTRMAEFSFLEAEDGADGLAKFDPNTIDIAFVDWNMPNMTGIEFVRQVRALGNTEHIPLVMVTSEKTMGKIEEALTGAGADGYICKPFTVEDLEVKLVKLLKQAQDNEERRNGAGSEAGGGGFFSRLFN